MALYTYTFDQSLHVQGSNTIAVRLTELSLAARTGIMSWLNGLNFPWATVTQTSNGAWSYINIAGRGEIKMIISNAPTTTLAIRYRVLNSAGTQQDTSDFTVNANGADVRVAFKLTLSVTAHSFMMQTKNLNTGNTLLSPLLFKSDKVYGQAVGQFAPDFWMMLHSGGTMAGNGNTSLVAHSMKTSYFDPQMIVGTPGLIAQTEGGAPMAVSKAFLKVPIALTTGGFTYNALGHTWIIMDGSTNTLALWE
ncbi:hypothetical protein FACS1894217_02670 [Clostridia bacterium]|nr:hypothetical protein FACS1894217_02670 [Clostridia bacterium]